MAHSTAATRSIDEWIREAAISFDMALPESLHSAVDRFVAALGDSVEIVGLGEPMHGAPEFLVFRNLLFRRLVETHGFRSIAVESSFPRGRLVNNYVNGATPGPTSYDDVKESGFSHGFGRAAANHELVDWMRAYNAGSAAGTSLRFYGFDSPTEMMWTDSPRHLIEFVLNYLASKGNDDEARRQRVQELLGNDAEWENQEAAFEPSKSLGLSPAANALRLEVEELVAIFDINRPEWLASDSDSYLEVVRYAELVRQLLTYHAAVARPSPQRIAHLLGLRDAMMADNLTHILSRERSRGRVLVFAHNSHLKRGPASWKLGPDLLEWWPAGAHLGATLGARYAVIGVGVGTSEENGIGTPEPRTLEALLTAAPGPQRLVPTHRGQAFNEGQFAALSTRSGSERNPGYFPLTTQSIAEFDWLAILDSIS